MFSTDKTELAMWILDHYNVRYSPARTGWQKIRCFNEAGHRHGDRNPSASVNIGEGAFKCHSCLMKGDGYAVLQQLEGWDVKKVNDAFGGVPMNTDESDVWL